MKVLYFYPENPLQKSQGNNARALALLNYFKSRSIAVDFVGVATEKNTFTTDDINVLKEEKLISNGYLLPYFKRKQNRMKYFWTFSLPNKFKKRIRMFDRCRLGHVEAFNAILKVNTYDFVIISYVCWTELIRNNSHLKKAKLLIDTHDLLTSQFQNSSNFKLGAYFQKEIELLNNFDAILAISVEEAYLYSQFTKKKVEIISHSLNDNGVNVNKGKTIDLLYVASDNEHNKLAAKWFFERVYPLLQFSLKIVVIGKIVDHFSDFPNVEKIRYAEDLDVYYSNAKIALCPMLTGTGLKIKVIEAMSYGLPIVCNERGVDGLFNKTNNGCLVTNDEKQFATYIHKLINEDGFYKINADFSKAYFLENNATTKVYEKLDKLFI